MYPVDEERGCGTPRRPAVCPLVGVSLDVDGPSRHTFDDMSVCPELRVSGEQLYGTLGDQLRELRVTAGLTQEQLARRIHSSQPAVAHLEAGRRTPTLLTLRKLALALGRDVTIVVPCGLEPQSCRLS